MKMNFELGPFLVALILVAVLVCLVSIQVAAASVTPQKQEQQIADSVGYSWSVTCLGGWTRYERHQAALTAYDENGKLIPCK